MKRGSCSYIIICPRAPRTFLEGVWGGFRGSKYLLRRYLEPQGCTYRECLGFDLHSFRPERIFHTRTARPWENVIFQRAGNVSGGATDRSLGPQRRRRSGSGSDRTLDPFHGLGRCWVRAAGGVGTRWDTSDTSIGRMYFTCIRLDMVGHSQAWTLRSVCMITHH